ncbi:GTP-binding protein [Candidatus Vidania fulgoroideorum]
MENNGAVIGIFGDVDNGKTTLLSKIFKKEIYEEEKITQKIRVLELIYKNKILTFIDTPGHDSFFIIVKKIIELSDINIILIDILNGLSKNLINILKEILLLKKNSVFLINKIDKVNEIDKKKKISEIKRGLYELGFILEEYGGENILIEISAIKEIGIKSVLENILLIISILKIHKKKFGYILKVKISKYMKYSNTLLLKSGKLSLNKNIYFKNKTIRITNINKKNKALKSISSYSTFEVLLSKPLEIGEKFFLKKDTKEVIISNKKKTIKYNCLKNYLFKTDCYSKYYAFKKISKKFSKKINFIFLEVGNLIPSDFKLSKSLKYKIIFFSENKPTTKEKIIFYKNIYDIYIFVSKIYKKYRLISQAKVLKIFKKDKKHFCGCKVIYGIFKNKKKVEIKSNNKVFKSEVISLMYKNIEKDFINENSLCGILLKNYKPYIGDIISIYEN